MRRALLGAVALGTLAASLGLAGLMAQRSATPSPKPSGLRSPATPIHLQRRTELREVIEVDLAGFPEGGTVSRDVTPETLLILEVRRRPAASPFRIVVEGGDEGRTQHDVPAVEPLAFPEAVPPECTPVRQAIESLIAARRVREADSAERAFSRMDTRACPQLTASLQAAFQKSHPFIGMNRQIPAGGQLLITIEQLAPDGGVSVKWDVTVKAQAMGQSWAHANEQEWLAAAIVRDIVGILSHAARSKAAPQVAVRTVRQATGGNAVVNADVTFADGKKVTQEIALEPHVFDPAAYLSLARAASGALGVRPSSAETSIGLPERLTHLRAAVLQRESDRVGAWLTRRPLDPSANEEAALIHLALALRESAGVFADVRTSVARATAHLAIAGLAGRAPSASGRIAVAALHVLIGRQAEVLTPLSATLSAPATPPEEKAWARALVLRGTGDWRIASKARPLSLLERLALHRAQRRGLGGLLALDMFATQKPEPVADWSWMALTDPFTVDEGNMFAGVAFPATVSELSDVVFKKEPGAGEPADVASALLATPAEGAVGWTAEGATVRVLDPALWTAFFSRHLAHSAHAAEVHYRERLGTPDRADAFAAQVEPYLAGTPWSFAVPVLRDPTLRGSRVGLPPCGSFAGWVQRQPEAIPIAVWEKFSACPNVPQVTAWFTGPVIPGTVLGIAERKESRMMVGIQPMLPRLRALNPYDGDLAAIAVLWAGKTDDPAAIAEAFGPRKDYDLSVMRRLASATGTPAEERRALLEKMCELSADECGELGGHLKENGEEAAAVVAFERELRHARDRVRMSFEMQWLALHYLDTGKADDAERVARAAAETYSQGGLTLLGQVLDRRGRLSEAEAVYKAIEQRYADRSELDFFVLRAQRRPGGGRFREEARRVMERVFPGGLERVTLANFSGPPQEGVEILHDTKGVRQLGLAKGDIIVAFDGYRTRNRRQYTVVRGMTEDRMVRLVAWSVSRKAYVDAKAELMDRRTGSDLRTYPARPGVE